MTTRFMIQNHGPRPLRVIALEHEKGRAVPAELFNGEVQPGETREYNAHLLRDFRIEELKP